ncbi:MAG: phosphate signaling complex protein PhoU, partial [Planctomycetota bacterium]|nr:phosphate signaling complex protein PhoU [Planctomycetota bacterium]
MPKRALEDLRRALVAQGELCEDALATAVMALVECDADLAVQVAARDCEIDEAEMAIDRRCRRLLQRGGLDAHSLRLAVAASKISNDLERIGDLAVQICQHALFLVRARSALAQLMELPALVEMVGQMIRDSISAVLDNDVELAWRIIGQRDMVEDETQVTFRQIVAVLQRHPAMSERCGHLLLIMQNFRNIAELAVNIAEEVIFLEKGKVVR